MSLRWYAHDLDAYDRDTGSLTMLQTGAYRLLLDGIYKTGKPLPADLVAVHIIARAHSKLDKAAVSLILNRYFTLKDDGWHNGRADEELDRAATLSDTRSKAASKRTAIAPAKALAIAHTTTSTTTKRKKDISSEFTEFWEAYPRKLSKGHALKAWPKAVTLATPEQIIAAAKAYAAQRSGEDEKFTKYPATWLSGMCWLDHAKSLNGKGPSLDQLLASKAKAEQAGIRTDKLDKAIAELTEKRAAA